MEGEDRVTVRLTDDEVVALAVDGGGTWPAPLPTINESEADQLIIAVQRGRRSIAARNGVFVGADGSAIPLAEVRGMIHEGCGTLPRLIAYLASPETPDTLGGLCLSVFPTEDADARMVVFTTPDGLNEISISSASQVRDLVRALVADVRASTQDARVVTLAAPSADGWGDRVVVGHADTAAGTDVPASFLANV